MRSTRNRNSLDTLTHVIGASESQMFQAKSVVVQAPQVLEQSQSVELMKIVSTAVISHIAHARNLFPTCRLEYEHRLFDSTDPDPSYKSFIKPETSTGFSESTHGLCFWKLLPRGAFSACDKLLDWLEYGVADALKRGYLKKLQFTIHDHGGTISEANLRESYTLAFRYGDEVGIELSSSRGLKNTQLVSTAKDQLYKLVRCVQMELSVDNSNHFKKLPRHCQVNMNLVYNDSCPKGYHAPGFKAAGYEVSNILRTASIDPRLSMNTAFHSVGVGWSIPLAAEQSSQLDPEGEPSLVRNLPSDQVRIDSSSKTGPRTSEYELLSGQHDMNPSKESLGAFKSTVLGGNHRELHDAIAGTHIISQPSYQRLALTTGTSQHDNEVALENPSEADWSIQCLCRLELRDLNVLECKSCGSYQHVICCGFLNSWPSDHICYECLLNNFPNSKVRLQMMSTLCTKRLLVHFLWERNSIATIGDLQQLFGNINMDEIFKALRKQKVIQPQFTGRRKVKADWQQKTLSIKLIASDQRIYEDYFDPRKWIEDLLDREIQILEKETPHEDCTASLPYPPSTSNLQDTLHATVSGDAGDKITMYPPKEPLISDDSTTWGEPSSPIQESPVVLPQPPEEVAESPRTPSIDSRKRKAADFAAPLENSLIKRQSWNVSQARTPPYFDRDAA